MARLRHLKLHSGPPFQKSSRLFQWIFSFFPGQIILPCSAVLILDIMLVQVKAWDPPNQTWDFSKQNGSPSGHTGLLQKSPPFCRRLLCSCSGDLVKIDFPSCLIARSGALFYLNSSTWKSNKRLDYDVIKIIFNMKTTKTFALAVFEVLHLLLWMWKREVEIPSLRRRFPPLFLARWLRLGIKSAMLLVTLKE